MIPEHLHALFWEVNLGTFIPASHPEYVIARILELGDEEAVAWMEREFPREKIAEVLRTLERSSLLARFYLSGTGLALQ